MSRLRQKELLRGDAGQQQVGALCWRRRDGRLEVLLVTSRETGRWVIPKGWPIPTLTPDRTAAREAWEEAGVRGRVTTAPIGVFQYDKMLGDDRSVVCTVAVHALAVDRVGKTWPEQRERVRAWLSPHEAAMRVREPELAALIIAFDPEPPSAPGTPAA